MNDSTHLTNREAKALAQRRVSAMPEPRKGQVYRHYKQGLYSIVSVSIAEDTLEVLVTYASNRHGGDTTRTLRDFTELVEVRPGHRVPRFRREAE